MRHLFLKRIWAVIVMILMMTQLLPIISIAETTDGETITTGSIARIDRPSKETVPVGIGEGKGNLPEGIPFVQMKDLSEFARVMGDLEKMYTDSREPGEDPDAIKRLCNSRVLLKGVPNFDGFQPLQVILDPYGIYVIQFDSVEEAERFIEKQSTDPAVLWAEQDVIVSLDEPAADMEENEMYNGAHLGNDSTKYVQAEELVRYIYENGLDNEVTVAVVDSGCELTHDFLRDRLMPNPPEGDICDFIDGDNDPSDEHGHGTHVAGIVVECTGDDFRALNVRIMPVRVLDSALCGSVWQISSGIRYAADNGADVINLSLRVDVAENENDAQCMENAVRYAVDKGCVVCAASGNDGRSNRYKAPANSIYPGVITVGALKKENSNWTICGYSNFGESVDIAAPGDQIYSSVLNNQRDYKSGTSMAAPHVAAAAAMIRQIYPGLSPAVVEEILAKATVDAGDPGRDDYYGHGNLQMMKILETDCQAPIITHTPEAVTAEWGTKAAFYAEGDGPGLTYQWEYRENEAGEWKEVEDHFGQSSEYAVVADDETNGDEYRCRIENYWGIVYTESATLTVVPKTSPDPICTGTFESGLFWEIDSDLTLRLYGEGWTDNYRYGEAPWYLWRNHIKSIDIGPGVLAIRDYAFADLSQLTSVVFPEGMMHIGTACLYNCEELKWVVIPKSMMEICGYAFFGCNSLTDVFFLGDSFPQYYPQDDSELYPAGTRVHLSYSGPIILNQTLDVDAIEGEQTTLVLEAAGADPNYQWYYRSSPGSEWEMIAGEEATEAEYTVMPTREMDGWQYRCFIQDMIGETYSESIPLYVAYESPVVSTQPRSQVVPIGRTARLFVKAIGGGLKYQWECREKETSEWQPVEEESGTNATLTVVCTEEKVGTQYRCTVRNALGTVVSRTAQLAIRTQILPFRPGEIKPINPIIIDPPIVIDPPVPVRPPVQSRLKMNRGK